MKIRTILILLKSCAVFDLCLSNLCNFSSKNVYQGQKFSGAIVKRKETNSRLECMAFCIDRENISFKASLCDNICFCYQNTGGKVSNTKCKSFVYELVNVNNCLDIYRCYSPGNGIYTITVNGNPLNVYCDMDGGGWTVLHRRLDGSVNFERSYSNYKNGFGSLSGEHWLGLDNICGILSSGMYEVRFDLEDFDGVKGYAEYSIFDMADSTFNYQLQISGYTGNVGDGMKVHDGMEFSAIDADNDHWPSDSCSVNYHGGWWYNNCLYANLNGLYNSTQKWEGVIWYQWRGNSYSLKTASFKIRQKQ